MSDLAERLRELGLRATAAELDDLVALATKERWSPVQLLEHVVDLDEKDQVKRSLDRRFTDSHIGRFKPMADFDWAWPTKIDREIVERALGRTMTSCHPVCASCVVIRPATGEILAMASLPSFLPQRPDLGPPANWRNHVISDRYEVGSAFKVITLAAALEHHAVTLDQRFDCHQGTWVYLRSVLHDDGHPF